MPDVAERKPFPILCLAGPTGCGKTALALALARRLPCEIINADSRQIYADFPLVCAQPTPEEQALCPHHLYGILPTTAKISAGEWCSRALGIIHEVLARKHVPLLVGGTGMYFHALLHGIVPIPPIDQVIRDRLEQRILAEGPEALHNELRLADPSYAAKIHPHDRQRIVRALEVLAQTGKSFSAWHAESTLSPPQVSGPLFVVRASMEWLVPRLASRITAMLEGGALTEILRARSMCPDLSAPGWSGIGCVELLAYADGRLDFAQCKELWLTNTRAYAKRQNTWFRGRKEAIFFAPEEKESFLARAEEAWRSLAEGRCKDFASA